VLWSGFQVGGLFGLLTKLCRDGDAGVGGFGISESDGVFWKGGLLRNSGEDEGAVGGEFESQLVCKPPHGPAGVDFTDGMPGEAFRGMVEKGIDADRAVIIVGFEELLEGTSDLLFCGGEDFVRDEAGVFRGQPAGGFGCRGGGDPLS